MYENKLTFQWCSTVYFNKMYWKTVHSTIDTAIGQYDTGILSIPKFQEVKTV